jgi:hypothetical protein
VSETPKKLNLDAALREWPQVENSREKTPMDWEKNAQRIEDNLRSEVPPSSAAYVSDEKILAEPLGQIEGEGHNSAAVPNREKPAETRVSKGETMTMPADRERDRRSLQDLAKLASGPLSGPLSGSLTPPPPSVQAPHSSAPSGVQRATEAKKDDSGIVDLAMAAQSDPQAAARAQSTPLANAGLFDDEPLSVRPGPVSSSLAAPVSQQLQQPAPSLPPFSNGPASLAPASVAPSSHAPLSAAPASFVPATQPSAAQSSSQHAAPASKKRGGVVLALVFGGLVAAGAVAAGGFLFMKHKAETAAAELALNTPPVVLAPVAEEPKPAEAATAAETPAPEPSVDPDTLPAAPEAKVAAAPKGGAVKASAPVAKAEKPAAPSKDEAAKLSAKDLPTTPAGPGGDLGAAMGAAVGADGKPVQATPAAGSNGPQFAAGTVPQKPSQGAVTGAIGAVLSGARKCLGPDDPVSRASITFASGGTVQSVNVSGGAAGKGCIKAALGKAKVAPFAEPTYTANITVRH